MSEGRRVLVCGGRDYADESRALRVLDEEHMLCRFGVVIQGGARGADAIARRWAQKRRINRETFTADWREGLAAGPKRNQRMLEVGRPDVIIAFPGGKGTADMVSRGRKAGVRIIEIPQDPTNG